MFCIYIYAKVLQNRFNCKTNLTPWWRGKKVKLSLFLPWCLVSGPTGYTSSLYTYLYLYIHIYIYREVLTKNEWYWGGGVRLTRGQASLNYEEKALKPVLFILTLNRLYSLQFCLSYEWDHNLPKLLCYPSQKGKLMNSSCRGLKAGLTGLIGLRTPLWAKICFSVICFDCYFHVKTTCCGTVTF